MKKKLTKRVWPIADSDLSIKDKVAKTLGNIFTVILTVTVSKHIPLHQRTKRTSDRLNRY